MNRIYKNKAEIKAAVYEAYITRNDELNSDYFSIPVKASVKALLEACTEIQDTINNRKGKIDMNRLYKEKVIKTAIQEYKNSVLFGFGSNTANTINVMENAFIMCSPFNIQGVAELQKTIKKAK